ncbi:multifunctional oxoglutarate decarboxylase/oxoglutarate dehydrogenase thiamine pyrophosphate-binding subunit/dihydrolipoyllysine-residue succinyltransferase subunit, partial [Streptomyces sp. NPDC056161]
MSPQSASNSSSPSLRPGGSTTTDEPAGKNPAAAFGANEWLVDEIYQQYLQDPNSVDRAWWDFFADYKPGAAAAPAQAGAAAAGAAETSPTLASAHAGEPASAAPAQPAAPVAPAAPAPAAPQPAAAAPAPAPAQAAPQP